MDGESVLVRNVSSISTRAQRRWEADALGTWPNLHNRRQEVLYRRYVSFDHGPLDEYQALEQHSRVDRYHRLVASINAADLGAHHAAVAAITAARPQPEVTLQVDRPWVAPPTCPRGPNALSASAFCGVGEGAA